MQIASIAKKLFYAPYLLFNLLYRKLSAHLFYLSIKTNKQENRNPLLQNRMNQQTYLIHNQKANYKCFINCTLLQYTSYYRFKINHLSPLLSGYLYHSSI